MKQGLNYREELAQRLAVLNAGILLDAGTGAGAMTKALVNVLSSSIVSIDVNKRVFGQVSEMVDRKRVDFLACDFAHLPFREDAFSTIVCDLVISTSRRWKPLPIYAEFRRTLKPNSSLFITDYYPEKFPTTREALLATQTSSLYRMVSEAKGTLPKKSTPPQSTVRQLIKAGFATVTMKRIEANEAQEWKKTVFREYYSGVKTEISSLNDVRRRIEYMRKLEELKREIETKGRINWAWGVNYIIQATK